MKRDNSEEKTNKVSDGAVEISENSAEIIANGEEPVKISITKTTNTPVDVINSDPETASTVVEASAHTIPKVNTMEENTSNITPTVPVDYDEWVVMPDSSWPPPVFIKKAVPPRERFYLENRWYSQWHYYDKKASENKDIHFRYQKIIVIGALIIPALVSINSTLARFLAGLFSNGSADAESMWRIGLDSITVMVSLMVAGAAALESLHKYGENWNAYRSAAEELQAEKNVYDMQAGRYANNPNAFATFVERVEGIIANQNGKYFEAVQQQLQKQGDENESIVASFKSGDDGDDTYELSVETSPTTTPAPTTEPVDIG